MLVKAQNETDYLLIEALAKEIWIAHYTPIIGKNQVDYMLGKYQNKEAIINQIKNEQCSYYIIKQNNEPVGYFAVQPKAHELFLSKFYVKLSQRGKGFGKEALIFIENLAKSAHLNKIALTVNKNNPTVASYEKMGFCKVESLITDVGNGYVMDDYKMAKYL